MANVLGELFQDIADSIREKTGDTGAMKPSQFAEKIGEIETGAAEESYNLALAETLMTRNAGYLSDDATELSMKGFVTSAGTTLGSLQAYSFAGFGSVKRMEFSDVIIVSQNVFEGDSALETLDFTVSGRYPTLGFFPGALSGCTALKSVIVRAGAGGINSVAFQAGSTTGANDTFSVYIPAEYYDTVIANMPSESDVPAERYLKLEE